MWITGARFIRELARLSPEAVDNQPQLWKGLQRRTGVLWINLWITGVKTVDKPVEKIVENCGLWITCHLSTIRPQGVRLIHNFLHRLGGEFSA
jgi:hypothetical protein